MRELDQHLKKQERVEIIAQQQKEHQKLLVGKIIPKRGHAIWQINTETLEVSVPDYSNTVLEYEAAISKDFSRVAEIVILDNCVYISALNAKNALKKFMNNKSQSHYCQKEPPMKLKDFFI
jgi:hypothetical protein